MNDIAANDLFASGISHAAAGDFLRAEQYLVAAKLRGYDESSAVYWLVRVCVAANRYQSALRHSADYLRRHPTNWPLRLVVASIYEALGDVPRARDELEQIVRVAPTHALSRHRLALVYDRQGDDRAGEHLEAYLRLAPDGLHAAEVRSALERRAENPSGEQAPSQERAEHSNGDELP